MLPKQFSQYTRTASSYIKLLFRFLFLSLMTVPAYAQQTVNITSISAENVLLNIAKQIPNLMQMVTAIAYVMGMYFIFAGIVKMRQLGEARTMMSHEHSVIGPLIMLAVGSLLLYLPTSVQVGLSSFWVNPNPYGYQLAQDQWGQFLNVCYLIIQFVGTVAFIRGLVTLSHLSERGGGASFGKGLTYIIGGILCINIYQFVQVILTTLGIQT